MFLLHSVKKIPQHKNMLQLTDPWDVETTRQLPWKEILTVTFQLFTFSYLKPDLQDKNIPLDTYSLLRREKYHCLWQMNILCWDNLE